MGQCRACRWWVADPHASMETDYDGWRVCALTTTWYAARVHGETLALAQDAEGYAASLHTAPAFGCVQFAPTVAPD